MQDGEILALGASEPMTVDVRVVAATHQRIESLVESGRFRRDLYAWLRGHALHLPPPPLCASDRRAYVIIRIAPR